MQPLVSRSRCAPLCFAMGLLVAPQLCADAQAWCGPHLTTYVRTESTVGDAVICVRFVDRASFAFYMEGLEYGRTFRRLGYAYRASAGGSQENELTFRVRWANITGNGEQIEGRASSVQALGTVGREYWDENRPPLQLVWVESPQAIWRLWDPGRALPQILALPPITKCGRHLRTYTVAFANSASKGIRCTLAANDHPIAAWVGAGSWDGGSYLHIGTAFFGVFGPRYGASDVCRPGFACSSVAFGDLRIDAESSPTVIVSGAWNEQWRPVR